MDQADKLRVMTRANVADSAPTEQWGGDGNYPKLISFASGKGGVGKTNIVANLGYCLSKQGKKVLLFDCDLGLGNLDILLGIASRQTLEHLLSGMVSANEIMCEGPGGMKILPAASGVQKLSQIDKNQQMMISGELDDFIKDFDYVLLDIGAGINTNVTYFCTMSNETIVIATPEPTSITDAYALMKVLYKDYNQNRFKLIVNMVNTPQESKLVYKQISMVVDKFLDNISLDYLGYVLNDENVRKCVKQQKLIGELFPYSKASRCYTDLAGIISENKEKVAVGAGVGGFFRNFLENNV
ncbi:MAG: MinD/ParA family protein [Nitrospinae bacterium]|nr:MinD/ParA family protein [Nitrospinota bacterium]